MVESFDYLCINLWAAAPQVEFEKNVQEFLNAWTVSLAGQNVADDKVDLANQFFLVSNLRPVNSSRV